MRTQAHPNRLLSAIGVIGICLQLLPVFAQANPGARSFINGNVYHYVPETRHLVLNNSRNQEFRLGPLLNFNGFESETVNSDQLPPHLSPIAEHVYLSSSKLYLIGARGRLVAISFDSSLLRGVDDIRIHRHEIAPGWELYIVAGPRGELFTMFEAKTDSNLQVRVRVADHHFRNAFTSVSQLIATLNERAERFRSGNTPFLQHITPSFIDLYQDGRVSDRNVTRDNRFDLFENGKTSQEITEWLSHTGRRQNPDRVNLTSVSSPQSANQQPGASTSSPNGEHAGAPFANGLILSRSGIGNGSNISAIAENGTIYSLGQLIGHSSPQHADARTVRASQESMVARFVYVTSYGIYLVSNQGRLIGLSHRRELPSKVQVFRYMVSNAGYEFYIVADESGKPLFAIQSLFVEGRGLRFYVSNDAFAQNFENIDEFGDYALDYFNPQTGLSAYFDTRSPLIPSLYLDPNYEETVHPQVPLQDRILNSAGRPGLTAQQRETQQRSARSERDRARALQTPTFGNTSQRNDAVVRFINRLSSPIPTGFIEPARYRETILDIPALPDRQILILNNGIVAVVIPKESPRVPFYNQAARFGDYTVVHVLAPQTLSGVEKPIDQTTFANLMTRVSLANSSTNRTLLRFLNPQITEKSLTITEGYNQRVTFDLVTGQRSPGQCADPFK